ncbi:Outer membrane protein TolC [Chitinophaga sp. YR573]|uniref:TolC family protein n=1 Tax=Chitinophaga sp. YR573 TaxID=1881040 RepID=UPI0008C7AC81|nr:TolC family protein [Chitinophaga sp. YR573]SEW43758.1 Outer membrane protein TolC [Chitinophaga sp. YR573]
MKLSILLLVLILLGYSRLSAQTSPGYSLQQLIDAAMDNSHLLSIREYQVQEKMSKLKEDEIKRYPSATVDGSYQYNFKLPEITLPAGTITTGLPSEDRKFAIGEKNTYNVGLNIYQPITQQFKMGTGLSIDKTDIKLGQKEKEKTALQMQLAIEQLYYGALIAQKQVEGTMARLELAQARLYDAEGALAAGKSTGVNLSGLRAGISGEEQNLLKLNIQVEDYLTELERLTSLHAIKLEAAEPGSVTVNPVDEYKLAATSNPDIEIAHLNKEKALLGIKAAKQSNLPDFGLIAGYYVQQGSPVLPGNSPYVGLNLKWNIQDLFSNKQVQYQRQYQLKQAEEAIIYTQQQVESDIDKAWRKVKQSDALITAAQKLAGYRREALKEQEDRQVSGLDTKTVLLEAKSQLAEAEADLYAAQLSKALAIAALRNLTGQHR